MNAEMTNSPLEEENKELRRLLDQANEAFALLQEAMEQYQRILARDSEVKMSDDQDHVKKLLEKYSRL